MHNIIRIKDKAECNTVIKWNSIYVLKSLWTSTEAHAWKPAQEQKNAAHCLHSPASSTSDRTPLSLCNLSEPTSANKE